MAVYMLRFTGSLGNDKHQAQYYVGYADDKRLHERIAEHRNGTGACITRAAIERGFELQLVLVIPKGTRKLERQLKNWKSHKRILDRFPMFHVLHPVVQVQS